MLQLSPTTTGMVSHMSVISSVAVLIPSDWVGCRWDVCQWHGRRMTDVCLLHALLNGVDICTNTLSSALYMQVHLRVLDAGDKSQRLAAIFPVAKAIQGFGQAVQYSELLLAQRNICSDKLEDKRGISICVQYSLVQ